MQDQDVCKRFVRLDKRLIDTYEFDLKQRTIRVKHPQLIKEHADILFQLINYRWAQKLEDLSAVLTERYRKMEMRALVPEIKANPLVNNTAIEAALTKETPKPRLVQLLVEAAPATLLAEAATAAGKLWCCPFQ